MIMMNCDFDSLTSGCESAISVHANYTEDKTKQPWPCPSVRFWPEIMHQEQLLQEQLLKEQLLPEHE